MRFESEDAAFEYWEAAYYMSGGGYEGKGVSFDGRVEIFKDWVEDQGITYLDQDIREYCIR